jgi:hypothetical protein
VINNLFLLSCDLPSIMKTCIIIIVLSNFFIFGKSEELSCKEVQEGICKSGTLYKEESFQTCLENNKHWKKYDRNKLELLVNPSSEFLLTIAPLGEYQTGSTTVGLAISQFQLKSETSCRINFDMKISHTFENGKIFITFSDKKLSSNFYFSHYE